VALQELPENVRYCLVKINKVTRTHVVRVTVSTLFGFPAWYVGSPLHCLEGGDAIAANQDNDMYQWKSYDDRWKGEGIYHLTFALRERRPILGTLTGDAETAEVVLSSYGNMLLGDIRAIEGRHEGVQVYCSMIMPDHLHLLLYIKRDLGKSIKELARGMRQGWKHLSPEMDFEAPFIRPLYHKGQLDAMFRYIHDNPHRAMLKRLYPDLYRIRRELQIGGMTFTGLGNLFLADYPQRQVVECSRTATEEQISLQQADALRAAQEGAVIYSGAVSPGEKRIVRALREAGFPVVVLLTEGFPPAGSEQEHYYKPGGVYFEACAAGQLLLLEATPASLEHPQVVVLTEQALREKAEAKHHSYTPLPHKSLRWRMMANNILVRLLTSAHC